MEQPSSTSPCRRPAPLRGLALAFIALVLTLWIGEGRAVAAASPTVSPIADRVINENTSSGAIAFTVDDADTPVASLTVTATSTNTTLFPPGSIVLGGSGANRTIALTPPSNLFGQSRITVTVNDGTSTDSTAFNIRVNDTPTLTGIANLSIDEDTSTGALTFSVADGDDDLNTLVVTATSSNLNLVAASGIGLGGSGASRTLTLTPRPDENGLTLITLSVADAHFTRSTNFLLTVRPVPDRPEITGTTLGDVANPIPDTNASTLIFSGILLSDRDQGRPTNETVSVVLEGIGMLPLGRLNGLDANTFTYTTNTPGNLTAWLQSLSFVPTPNQAPVGPDSSFVLRMTLSDQGGLTVESNYTVYIRSINDAPFVASFVAPSTLEDTADALPFSIDIDDPDIGDNEGAFTVSVTALTGTNLLDRMEPSTTFTGTRAQVQQFIRTVRVTPRRDVASPAGQNLTFRFTVIDRNSGVTFNTNSLRIVGVNDLPEFSGISRNVIRITDDTNGPPFKPFANVRVVDPDESGNQLVTVRITPSDPALGSFTGSTTINSATPASATVFLANLVYMPSQNQIPAGQTRTVTFTLFVQDSAGASRVNSETVVAITGVGGGAPRIDGVPATTRMIPPTAVARPFVGITVTDTDTNLSFSVTLDNREKGQLTGSGFTEQPSGSGVYRMSGTPQAITLALTNLVFQPSTTFLFPPSEPGGTTFTLEANDPQLNRTVRSFSILLQNEPRNFLVNSIEDDGSVGTFRNAVTNAQNNDVITFALTTYPAIVRLDPARGEIDLARNLTIRGPGADLLTISGDGNGDGVGDVRIFKVRAAVIIEGLTLSHGRAPVGGAAAVEAGGRLTLRSCAVVECAAEQWGGAVDVEQGGLMAERTLFRNNRTESLLGMGGGAVSLYTTQECSFVNCTFSGNRQESTSGIGGGALYVENRQPSAIFPVQIRHCTFAGNQDARNKATAILANVFNTQVRLRNTIFGDARGRNLEITGSARFLSEGGNFSDDATQTILAQGGQPQLFIFLDHSTDRRSATLRLGGFDPALRPVAGHPLDAGSPALDHSVGIWEPLDQRGILRQNQPDAGALERGASGRIVLNEVNFSPLAGESDFVELYIPRNSTPVNIGSYSIWVDGTNRHTFPTSTILQPGRGIVVREGAWTVPAASSFFATAGSPLSLGLRGQVELTRADGARVIHLDYVGQFVDPNDAGNPNAFPNNSITLHPQFAGAAYVPHRWISASTNSPAQDNNGTIFGSPNAIPLAGADRYVLSEDDAVALNVLANDQDADGLDALAVMSVSRILQTNGISATALTRSNATVTILPLSAPPQGTSIFYDPRTSSDLQQLPEGARIEDQFFYEIIDFGRGTVEAYASASAGSVTLIRSAAHRLQVGDAVEITGSSLASYNNTFIATPVDDDSFSIAAVYGAASNGTWRTTSPRTPSARRMASVTLTILGANDPPVAVGDNFTTDEEMVLRILGDATLIASAPAFDTDVLYPLPRQIAPASLLANDSDPDSDDDFSTMRVVGVLSRTNAIQTYTAGLSNATVVVTATNHGLVSGTSILIAGYGGHPSYNGYHLITVLDANRFSLPVPYVDGASPRGAWVILDNENRYSALSAHGAQVRLEIRRDRAETSIVYNPRTSSALDHLAVGEQLDDTFYYAVEDRHGAIGIAPIRIRVNGVNDTPVPRSDPDNLALLQPLVNSGRSLSNVVQGLELLSAVPALSGSEDRVDLRVRYGSNSVVRYLLSDMWTTREDKVLLIASTILTSNDRDVDTSDILNVIAVSPTSREGAAVTLAAGGAMVTYDPTISAALNRLSRKELVLDTFRITVSDGHGGTVDTLVAVLVVGVNDTPVARNDFLTDMEDTLLVFNPITFPLENAALHDSDADKNGIFPDDVLRLVVRSNIVTLAGARAATTSSNTVVYDPAVSAFLNGLAQGQIFDDRFTYTVTDGSFLFANDDRYRVQADGNAYVLQVLDNDRNLTGNGTAFSVTSVGEPDNAGTVAISSDKSHLVYTPAPNFVGNETFTYSIIDELGNRDSATVVVRVTVDSLNGTLRAGSDIFVVAKGQAPLLDVLANDGVIPGGAAGYTIRIVEGPVRDGVVVIGNQVLYRQTDAGPFPYEVSFAYEVSGGGPARTIAQVTVKVVNREGDLPVRNDGFSVAAGSRDNPLSVLANDSLLPGGGPSLRLLPLNINTLHGVVRTNSTATALLYTPAAGFTGNDLFSYVATDGFGGTGTGVVHIAVGALSTSDDFFAVPYDDPLSTADDGVTELDVLANDRILQAPGENLRIITVVPGSSILGVMTIRGDGQRLIFDPAVGEQGEAEFTYTIQNAAGTGPTAQGKVRLQVTAEGVIANPDQFAVARGSSGNTLDVLANDAAIPDRGRALTIVSVGTGLEGPNRGGAVSPNASNSRLIYTPAAGFSGEESFTYTMTDSRGTATAKVVVRVADGLLAANQDTFSVFFDLAPGASAAQSFILPVLANDRAIPDLGQVLKITGTGIDDLNASNAPSLRGTVSVNGEATALVYTPKQTNSFPYLESFTYEITDGGTRRAEGHVTVVVEERVAAREVDTQPDRFQVAADSVNNPLPVLANDNVKPAPATGWRIASVTTPTYGGIVNISGQTILYTPRPGFLGTDEFTYRINDGLGGGGGAVVRVQVGAQPLSEDYFSVLSGTQSNLLDVLANDALRPVTPSGYQLQGAFGIARPTALLVVSNRVAYTPDAAYAGAYPYSEEFLYTVRDDSSLLVTGRVAVTVYETGSDRSTAEVTIHVVGTNDAPVITGMAQGLAITDKQTIAPFSTLLLAEVDDQGAQPITVTIAIDDPVKGVLKNLGGFTQSSPGNYVMTGTAPAVTTHIRQLIFEPTRNRITVPTTENTTFYVSAVDGFVDDPVTIQTVVAVTAVNDAPTIVGTVAGQRVYQRLSLRPFNGVVIGEVDDLTLQPLIITVTLNDATHGYLSNLVGFIPLPNGVYRLSGVSAQVATTKIRGLVFVPTTDNRVPPLQAPELTRFTIQVEDGFAPPVIDATTTVSAFNAFIKKLMSNDGDKYDEFGYSVATSRDLMVVGVPFDDVNGNKSGAAYLFGRNVGGPEQWGEIKRLIALDAAKYDQFGYAVSISGDAIAIGARMDEEGGKKTGSAYIFSRNQGGPNNWGQLRKLLPVAGDKDDEFGSSVSIQGDTVLVGSHRDRRGTSRTGAAYFYNRHAGGSNQWGYVQKVTPADGSPDDHFGISVSLDGDTAVIGSHFHAQRGGKAGTAYVLNRNQGGLENWGQVAKLFSTDVSSSDEFGRAVSISGTTIAVGGRYDVRKSRKAGSVALFDRDAGGSHNWGQVAIVGVSDPTDNDEFGFAVALDGETLVVGARLDDDNGSASGSIHLFRRNNGGPNQWGLVEKILPLDGDRYAEFGYSVAISANTVAVGARRDEADGKRFGATYVYRIKFNNSPRLSVPIPDQTVSAGSILTYTVPAETFGDVDFPETLTYSARRVDGSALPTWIAFNPLLRRFTISPAVTDVGNWPIRVTVTDDDGATASTDFNLSVTPSGLLVVPEDSLLAWRQRHFGNELAADLSGDADSDGRSDLREYLFGSNPNVPDRDTHAQVSISPDPEWPGRVHLTYARRLRDIAIRYTVEASSNFSAWQPVSGAVINQTRETISDDFERVTITLESDLTGTTTIYRLRVER